MVGKRIALRFLYFHKGRGMISVRKYALQRITNHHFRKTVALLLGIRQKKRHPLMLLSAQPDDFTFPETKCYLYIYIYQRLNVLFTIPTKVKVLINDNIKNVTIWMHNTEPITHKIKINLLKKKVKT